MYVYIHLDVGRLGILQIFNGEIETSHYFESAVKSLQTIYWPISTLSAIISVIPKQTIACVCTAPVLENRHWDLIIALDSGRQSGLVDKQWPWEATDLHQILAPAGSTSWGR